MDYEVSAVVPPAQPVSLGQTPNGPTLFLYESGWAFVDTDGKLALLRTSPPLVNNTDLSKGPATDANGYIVTKFV